MSIMPVDLAFNFQDLFMLSLEEVFKVPLHNHCILDISGEVDVEKLNTAVLCLMDEYPVMKMRPEVRFSFRRLTHVSRQPIHDFDGNVVHFLDLSQQYSEQKYDKEIANFINAPLNVWKEAPLRILLIEKKKKEYSILFKMHHYATDGIGAICFVSNLIEEYNRTSSISQRTVKHGNGGMLAVVPHRKLFRKHLFLQNISDMLARCINAAFLPSVRLSGGQSNAQCNVNALHKLLKTEELGKLKSKAKAAQVTLNEYFAAASILAIDRWNSEHGEEPGRISVEMPVNLRPMGSFYQWMGNWCSSVSISSRPKDRVDFDTLLQKVKSRTRSVFENGLAYTLVYMAAWTRFLPFGVVKFLSRLQVGTGADTTVVSFLGNVIRFQDASGDEGATIKVIDGVLFGPVCHRTGCSVWFYILRDRLKITFAYRDTLLTTDQAGEFLELLAHMLG